MRSRSYLLLTCASLAGCSAASAGPRDEARRIVVRTETHDEGTPLGADGRIVRTPLEGATPTELPFRVLEVDGAPLVLVVAEEPQATHVRSADERGDLGPLQSLAGRRLAGAVATSRPWLVTSDGRTLSLESLDGTTRRRAPLDHADAVVSLARNAVAWLDERVAAPPEPVPTAKPAPRSEAHAATTKPKPKAEKRRRPAPRAKATRPRTPTPPKPPPPVKPSAATLWLASLDDRGTATPAHETGLTYARPLPGMGLVAARGTTRGASVLVHDAEPTRRERGRTVPFAQILAADLDETGKLRATPRALVGGPRQYGWIEGHLRPRLFTDGERGLYVGRREVPEGRGLVRRFEAYLFDGSEGTATDAVWIADPRRFLGREAPEPVELEALARLAALEPRAMALESLEEPGRIAWAGASGYFVRGSSLASVGRATAVNRDLGAPFRALRPESPWSVVDSSGRALMGTRVAVHEAKPRAAVASHAPLASVAGAPVSGAFVGDRALGLVPTALDRTHPGGLAVVDLVTGAEEAELSRDAHLGASALVGDGEGGVWLALRGDLMTVNRLDAAGRAVSRSQARSPIHSGFAAASRAAGGAIVVGLGRPPTPGAVAFVIDRDGTVGEPNALPVRLDPGRIGLAPLPGGGALVWDEPDARMPNATPRAVVWLDDDGRVLAHGRWSADAGADAPACPVGRRLPGRFPTPHPGEFVALPLADACTVGMPRWTDEGLRWFGVRAAGLDAAPELVTVRFTSVSPSTPRARGDRREVATTSSAPTAPRCPADMVLVADAVCVDRYESQLVEARGEVLSPSYPTDPAVVSQVLEEWTLGRLLTGDLHARSLPLPPLLRSPKAAVTPVATSRPGVVPSGYLSSFSAEAPCRAAGKRLCTLDEWTRACRGEEDRDFPYGDEYEQGACNVHRFAHPAATLHGNASTGHLDPRLHWVEDEGEPMLRPTGSSPGCVSRWGRDGLYDMVGNLDEWVDDPDGAFAGGFHARSTKRGCGAVITVHPRRYFDYSLGTRCCLTP